MARKPNILREPDNNIFAERLTLLMERPPRTTQERLAKELGITRQAVGGYKTGISTPDCKTLKKIAEFFNVTADYLIGVDTKAEDKEKCFVYDYMGLSPASIDTLHVLTPGISPFNALDGFIKTYGMQANYTLCCILESTANADNILSQIETAQMDNAPEETRARLALAARKAVDELELSIYRFSALWSDIADMYNSKHLIDRINLAAADLMIGCQENNYGKCEEN